MGTGTARRHAGVLVVAATVASAAAVFAANSSAAPHGGSTATAHAAATPAWLADDKKIVAQGYKGDFDPPPTSGPKAVRGKTVWFISCGQAYIACVTQADGFAQAGKHLGWKVTIQDGKATPSVANSIIEQAVAAHVNAIAVAGFDCPGVKTALLKAKAAKIPVIEMGALDCNDSAFGNGTPLYTAHLNYRGLPTDGGTHSNAGEFFKVWGEARAQYIVAQTNGKGNILAIQETSQRVQQENDAGAKEVYARCTTCKVKYQDWTFSQVPNPANQIWKEAILADPSSNAFDVPADALWSLGLDTDVEQAHHNFSVVGGAEGFPLNFSLIRQGVQTFSVALPYLWGGWACADTVNRVLAGQNPKTFPSEGLGWQYVDKTHNLPAPGKSYVSPVSFQAAYEKIWGS